MDAEDKQPWERQEGESLVAYSRFLAYRNLGPSRSLHKAEWIHGGAEKGALKRNASGCWWEDSAKFRWLERATKWDIYMLLKHGDRTVLALCEMVRLAATSVCESLVTLKPKTHQEAMEALQILAPYIPQDFVAKIAEHNAALVAIEPVKQLEHSEPDDSNGQANGSLPPVPE